MIKEVPNPNQIQQIIDALNKAAGGAWNALVAQQRVIGIQGVLWCSFMFAIGLASLFVTFKLWKKARSAPQSEKNGTYSFETMPNWTCWLYAFASISSAAAATLLFLAPMLVIDALGHLLNPAGYAIRDLLGK